MGHTFTLRLLVTAAAVGAASGLATAIAIGAPGWVYAVCGVYLFGFVAGGLIGMSAAEVQPAARRADDPATPCGAGRPAGVADAPSPAGPRRSPSAGPREG